MAWITVSGARAQLHALLAIALREWRIAVKTKASKVSRQEGKFREEVHHQTHPDVALSRTARVRRTAFTIEASRARRCALTRVHANATAITSLGAGPRARAVVRAAEPESEMKGGYMSRGNEGLEQSSITD